MATSRETVLAALAPDEIDYESAADHLGADALPVLLDVIRSGDPALAPKAAHLAGAIAGTDQQAQVIEVAAASRDPVVRIAASTLAARLPIDAPADVLERLLDDEDVGVRKQALRSAARFRTQPGIRRRLTTMTAREPVAELKALAQRHMRPE